MTNKPLVSIIIPIYNKEPYIRECVDSVVNQTLKEIEIILVDDESPDLCPEICDEYAAKDSRIKAIHQKNMGHSFARNTGIEYSRGEYLMFVDSDDFLYAPTVIEKMYNEAIRTGADVVMSNILSLTDGKISNSFCRWFDYDFEHSSGIQTYEVLLERRKYHASMCSRLFKRELIIDNNLLFQKLICDDEEWTPKIFYLSNRIMFLDVDCYVIRHIPNTVTSSTSIQTYSKKVLDRCVAVNSVLNFFATKCISKKQRRLIYSFMFGLFLSSICASKFLINTEYFTEAINALNDTFEVVKKQSKYLKFKYKIYVMIITIIGIKGALRLL